MVSRGLPKEERLRILQDIKENGFKIWPTPANGAPYGPTPKQAEALLIPHKHPQDVCLYYGGRRAGKCLGLDTEVLMYSGQSKKVQNIEINDMLMGPDSLPRRVISLIRGREPMYKIIPTRNAKPFICNESHILSLSCCRSNEISSPRFKGELPRTTKRYPKQIVNVSVRDYLAWGKRRKSAYCLYTSGSLDFPKLPVDLPIDPYIFGVWLGDGDSSGFTITTIDQEIKQAIAEFAEDRELVVSVSDQERASRYAVSTGVKGGLLKNRANSLIYPLRELGVVNNKHVPEIYKLASQEQRLQLLAGLLDTDGYLAGTNKTYYEITQKREQLAKDIVFVAKSLGMYASIKPVQKHCFYKGQKREGTYYRVNISPEGLEIPVRIARKKMNYYTKKFNYSRFGFSVECLGVGDYYGFSLEGPDSLFIISPSFFVTHNSAMAVAAGLEMVLGTPGIIGMVGCEQFNHLEKSTMDDYRKMLTIRTDWDHPLVYRKPTSHNNRRLQFINGSSIYFMHFSDFTVLRGLELAFGHIEEASLLKDKSVFGEIQGRLSSNKVKCLRLFVTSNPEERKGWLYETFNLQQFEPTYKGDPLSVGKPCLCRFCSNCASNNKEVLWKDGTCPECQTVKFGECPGGEYFWRVVMGDPKDNAHLPQHYRQTQRQSTTDVEFNLYTEGQVIELRSNRVYPGYKEANNVAEVKLDYAKPMFWNFDFNIAFQCSALVQEIEKDGQTYCDVFDEIVLPNAGPEQVALEWLKRYKNFDQTVYFVFDPAAFNNAIRPDDGGVRVKIIREILEYPDKFGFPDIKPKNCVMLTKKIDKKTKVAVSARVDSVNKALDDKQGFHRIRISPHCKWLIRSLEDLKWADNDGKPVIDIASDKLAAKAVDKTTLRTLSHPTDALGYYICKRFPVVGPKFTQMYALLPGEAFVKTSFDGKSVEVTKEKKKPKTELDHLKLMFDLDEGPDPSKMSLKEMLTQWGAFEDENSSPFSLFW